MSEQNGNSGGSISPSVKLASAVTVVVLVVYGVAVWAMWGKADAAQEPEWSRLTFLLSGIEAITFTAVGWLFGREVNRVRAEKAEAKQEQSQADADTAKEQAAKATTAGTMIRRALEGDDGDDRLGATRSGQPTGPDIRTLARLAEVFPRDM